MHRILVWDLPVRIFHWLLTATIVATFALALGAEGESSTFPLHMLLGLLAAVMVLLRVAWGVVGSRYARFSSFAFSPRAVGRYLVGILTRSEYRWLGHNPGSSYAICAMLVLVLALAASGTAIAAGAKGPEEMHEVLAYALLIIAIAHLLGLGWHALSKRDGLVRSMLDGKKQGAAEDAIPSAHPLVALSLVAVVAGTAAILVSNYDARAQTLAVPVVGRTLLLRERRDEAATGHERDDDDGDGEGHRDPDGHP